MWYSDSRRRKVSRDVTRTPRILENVSEGRGKEEEVRRGRAGEVKWERDKWGEKEN